MEPEDGDSGGRYHVAGILNHRPRPVHSAGFLLAFAVDQGGGVSSGHFDSGDHRWRSALQRCLRVEAVVGFKLNCLLRA